MKKNKLVEKWWAVKILSDIESRIYHIARTKSELTSANQWAKGFFGYSTKIVRVTITEDYPWKDAHNVMK